MSVHDKTHAREQRREAEAPFFMRIKNASRARGSPGTVVQRIRRLFVSIKPSEDVVSNHTSDDRDTER